MTAINYYNKISQTDKIICKLLCLWLLIDAINGFLLRNSIGFPVSQIFKVFLILLMLVRICRYRRGGIIFFVILFYVVIEALHYSFNNVENISGSFQLLFKPISNIIIFFYFKMLMKKNQNYTYKQITTIFKFNFMVFAINILLGPFGFGFRSYELGEDNLGYVGFFYSLNELGGVVAAIYPIFLYWCFKKGIKWYLLGSILVLLLSVLVSSKACIFTAVLSVLFILLIESKHKTIAFILIAGLIITLFWKFNLNDFLTSDSLYSQKISYAYDKGGIAQVIWSNRNDFAVERTQKFWSADFFNKLLGLGGNRTVEIDPYDILLNLGYFGLLICVLMWCYFGKQIYSHWRKSPLAPVILLSDIMLFGMSIFAGHIFFSSTAGLFISILNTLIIYVDEKEKISYSVKSLSVNQG